MLPILSYILLAIGVACFSTNIILWFCIYRRAKVYDKEVQERFGEDTDECPVSERDVTHFQKILQKKIANPLRFMTAAATAGLVFTIAGMVLKCFFG